MTAAAKESAAKQVATVIELDPVEAEAKEATSGGQTKKTIIRSYRLSLNGVVVELCSVGASLTKLLLPNFASVDSAGVIDVDGAAGADADDCVLGYSSPLDMLETGNPPYFGTVVGRVANRIEGATFRLDQRGAASAASTAASAAAGGGAAGGGTAGADAAAEEEDGTDTTDTTASVVESYALDANNGPNHLHGGHDGFSHRIWDASIVEDLDLDPPSSPGNANAEEEVAGRAAAASSAATATATATATGVRFTLVSPDGDQGYPGGVKVTATYSLVAIAREEGGEGEGDAATTTTAVLRLNLRGSLLSPSSGGDNDKAKAKAKATPISLAQHSYFNLSRHDDPSGVLSHRLTLPNCPAYTPVDPTSIPTREVRSVLDEPTMDFRCGGGKVLGDALVEYGVDKAGLDVEEARRNVEARLLGGGGNDRGAATRVAKGGNDCPNPGEPYGFDHNYVVDGNGRGGGTGGSNLRVAGVLEHPNTLRRMEVRTDAPGVQLYTANYLDGKTPDPVRCKDGACYGQWQGVCLETQHYPSSIFVGGGEGEGGGGGEGEIVEQQVDEKEFAKGRCFVLRPGGEDYVHNVEYRFGKMY